MKSKIKFAKIKNRLLEVGIAAPTPDDALVERKQLHSLEGADVDSETAYAKITTLSVDSDGDVIIPQGLDSSVYTKNPIVLFQHDYSKLPVGRTEQIVVNPTDVTAKMKFTTATEFGRDVWALVKDNFIRACSIGFVPLEQVTRGNPLWNQVVDSLKGLIQIGPECKRIVTKWLLLENSIVTIPTNNDALVMAVSKSLDKKYYSLLGLQEPHIPIVKVIGHIPTPDEVKQIIAQKTRKIFID